MGNDPFAVLLADDFLTYEGAGVTADLARAFETSGKTQLSVMEVNGQIFPNMGLWFQMENQDQLQALSKSLMLTKHLQT